MKEEFSWLLIGLLAATLLAAAIGDWRSRIIPNRLNAVIALLAVPYWWAIGVSLWPGVALQLGVAACVFGAFALMFHFEWMGGGDVKLAGALALWLPAVSVLKMLVVMSLAGGVLTLVMLIAHRIAKSAGNPEVPYGIAIAFAGLWIIGERFLNQFV
jgi:prepilin peptidase CpaA